MGLPVMQAEMRNVLGNVVIPSSLSKFLAFPSEIINFVFLALPRSLNANFTAELLSLLVPHLGTSCSLNRLNFSCYAGDPHIVMLPLAYHQWPTIGWLLRIGHRNHSGGPLGYFMASQGVLYAVIGWVAAL